jgi:site-specific DNA recombinase
VTLDELDLEIHFVKENVVLSKESRSSEKFMHGIKVLMAKNYIDNLSEETKKGMIEKAEQGIYPSFAPLGYINVECEGKRLIQPDPVAGPQVRKLFEWYSTGNYSIVDVAQKAYDEGFTFRKTNRKIPKNTINGILKNPLYYGEFLWDGKTYKGIHEPLVTRELYTLVQEVMSEKGRRGTVQQRHNWAFQGLLSCGHCGCALVAEIKKKRYVYYHCTGNRGKCPEKWVREEEVDRQFREAIKAIRMDSDILEWVKQALKESQADTKKYHTSRITELQSQYQKLQHRLDSMYEDKLDGRINQEFYDRKSSDWKREQEEVLSKLSQHQSANRSYLDEGIALLELAQHAVMLYEKQDYHEKRRILNFVCSNSIWKDGSLTPSYRQPFGIIAESNRKCREEEPCFQVEKGVFDFWLPEPDSNQRPSG